MSTHNNSYHFIIIADFSTVFWSKQPPKSLKLYIESISAILNSIQLIHPKNEISLLLHTGQGISRVIPNNLDEHSLILPSHRMVACFLTQLKSLSSKPGMKTTCPKNTLYLALAKAVLIANKSIKIDPTTLVKVVCLQVTDEHPVDLFPTLNAFFSLQNLRIPISSFLYTPNDTDSAKTQVTSTSSKNKQLPKKPFRLLPTGANMTKGLSISFSSLSALLPLVLSNGLSYSHLKPIIHPDCTILSNTHTLTESTRGPKPQIQDFSLDPSVSSCFCCRKVMNTGKLCPYCLSLYCQRGIELIKQKDMHCLVCNSQVGLES